MIDVLRRFQGPLQETGRAVGSSAPNLDRRETVRWIAVGVAAASHGDGARDQRRTNRRFKSSGRLVRALVLESDKTRHNAGVTDYRTN